MSSTSRASSAGKHTFVLILVVLATALPRPAQAWFGWLDKFSGPGPFKGKLIEARLFCFGAERPDVNQDKDTVDAVALTRRIAELPPGDELRRRIFSVRQGWKRSASPPMAGGVALPLDVDTANLATSVQPEVFERVARLYQRAGLRPPPDFVASVDKDERLVQAEAAEYRDYVEATDLTVLALASVGALWSFCDSNTVRSFSVDLAVNAWTARGSEHYANNKPIWLLTTTAGVSWRIPSWKIVDLGIAGGRYAFLSKGFSPITGWMVEPSVSVHFPQDWVRYPHSDARRWMSAVGYRYSRVFLLNNLDPARLEARFGAEHEIDDKWGVGASALFINFRNLVQSRKGASKP